MQQILNLTAQVYKIDTCRYFCETEKGSLLFDKNTNLLQSVELSLENFLEQEELKVSYLGEIIIKKIAPQPLFQVSSDFLSRIFKK
jgi:hypothetical protein